MRSIAEEYVLTAAEVEIPPMDATPAAATLAAARDAQPKRTTLLHEQLSNSQTVPFHSLAEHDADES